MPKNIFLLIVIRREFQIEIIMNVFISHISEEAEVAIVLKEWIESTFLGEYEVFVSSDSESIPAGTKWLEEMTKAITTSKIILLLCSPESIYRPWINFEAGCGWAQNKPVIPICYGGLTKGNLPPPINALQALDFNKSIPEKLFSSLMSHLDIKRLPRIDYKEMYRELDVAIGRIDISEVKNQIENSSENESNSSISDEKLKILEFLASINDYAELPFIARGTDLNLQRVAFYLEELSEISYINTMHSMMSETSYKLAHKGRELLFKMDLI